MLLKILNFLCGYRKISCKAERACHAVNIFMQNEVEYWSPKKRENGELVFFMLDREWRRISPILGEAAGEFKTERQYGLPQLLRRYKMRLGIPTGAVAFLILIWLSTGYVWDISVSGNDYLSDEAVAQALGELNFKVGSKISSVDFNEICHEFILKNDEVSWISVNMVGTTAEVKIREKESYLVKSENRSPSNLVAQYDGIIVRTETESGQTAVKGGQTVKKGELLVSGVVQTDRDDESKFVLVRSKARIYAQTERLFRVEIPLRGTDTVYSGRKILGKAVNFFGNNIKLKENSSISGSECDIIKDSRRIVLFEDSGFLGGIPLPIWICTEYTESYTENRYDISEAEASRRAGLEMARLVNETVPDAEILSKQIRSELIKEEECDVFVLTWQMVCIEDIAKEAPIGVAG